MDPENRRSRKGNGNCKEDPPRITYKRKRSANFSADEKMRFLYLLRDKGKVIISKATSHDVKTNKMKEQAWDAICRNLNSNGHVMRSTDTLKNLWQKLKSDVKTKTTGQQARGTSSTKLDNSVLELVIEMTGSGNNGIIGVPDCDSNHQLPDDDSLDENSQIVEEVAELPNLPKSLLRTKHKEAFNETCDPEPAERSNSCAERLRSEPSKLDLIEHKVEQETEFHQLRMQHERQLFLLKEQILKKVLKRIEDGDNFGPGILELALSTTGGK